MTMDIVSKTSPYRELNVPKAEVKMNESIQAMEQKTVKFETLNIDNNQEDASQDNSQKNQKQIENAIKDANNKIKKGKTRCEFSYHETTKRISIKVIDKETDEVIREVPPEETLKMIEKLWEIAGIMVDEKR